ncbi:hypothetical protein SNE40_017263 [Patella caerulea]|uniref:Tetraspanin n=1 Tax=Patella caerulea TaxID=87958 RepID=A0AAN8JEQ3_PATCE
MECSGIILISINILFMLIGLAVLIMGVVFKVHFEPLEYAFLDDSDKTDFNLSYAFTTLTYSLMVFGVFIILVALLGFSGAHFKSKIILVAYAVIVMIILVAEITVVTVAVTRGTNAEKEIKDGLEDSLRKYKENDYGVSAKAFNTIWSTFGCCGIDSYADFKDGNITDFCFHKDNTHKLIPVGCCKNVDYEAAHRIDFKQYEECLSNPTEDNAYLTGCYSELKDAVTQCSSVSIGVGIFILIVEVVVIFAAFCQCCREDDKYIRPL